MRHAALLASAACAVVVLGPMLAARGFWLHYDMVFVPHLPFSATTLGTGGQVPRAVPNDAVVALLDLALPGDVTQKIVLLGAFLAVGAGVDRWCAPLVARVCASVLLVWNPWFAERLAIGHWGYLWGYAACVWAVVGALAARRANAGGCANGAEPSVRGTIVVALVMSAASGSTGAVLVALALVAICLVPGPGRIGWRPAALSALAWVTLNAAWWWPFLTAAPSSAADAVGVDAFASRADGAGPVWLSLLGGGGIWHSPSWFAERGSVLVALAAAIVGVVGVVVAARRLGVAPIPTLAGSGLALAVAGAVPGVRDVMRDVVLHVPGGGLLRDGQKFVALWIIPAALGWGLLAAQVRERGRGSILAPVALVCGMLAPIALLPGFAWSRHGQWQTVSYPSSWVDLAHRIDRDHDDGAVLALPWSTYRRYAWNGQRVVLDPWNRLLQRRVISDDALTVHSGGSVRVVAGEDPDAAAIARALASNSSENLRTALRDADIATVLVQVDQPGAASAQRMLERAGATRAEPADHGKEGHVPVLYRVAGPHAARATPWWRAVGLVVAIVAALATTGYAFRPDRATKLGRRARPDELRGSEESAAARSATG